MDESELFRHWIETKPLRPKERDEPPRPSRSKSGQAPRLDLHGYNLEEAQKALTDFLRKSRARGQKKAIVITGLGINSDRPGGVLREGIASYLDRRLAGPIKGFRQGNPHEGGAGVLIVYL